VRRVCNADARLARESARYAKREPFQNLRAFRKEWQSMTLGHAAALALVGLVLTMKTWRADFFDDPDDRSPSRSVVISADNEDEAVEKAVAQMGEGMRVEFSRVVSRGIGNPPYHQYRRWAATYRSSRPSLILAPTRSPMSARDQARAVCDMPPRRTPEDPHTKGPPYGATTKIASRRKPHPGATCCNYV
jgi:hypothetical protein